MRRFSFLRRFTFACDRGNRNKGCGDRRGLTAASRYFLIRAVGSMSRWFEGVKAQRCGRYVCMCLFEARMTMCRYRAFPATSAKNTWHRVGFTFNKLLSGPVVSSGFTFLSNLGPMCNDSIRAFFHMAANLSWIRIFSMRSSSVLLLQDEDLVPEQEMICVARTDTARRLRQLSACLRWRRGWLHAWSRERVQVRVMKEIGK
jgi:hypothetical protein